MAEGSGGAQQSPHDLVRLVTQALQATFGSRLQAVLVAGSVAKDDWIPFWSDLDIHVFIENLASSGLLLVDTVLGQQSLGKIDRATYQIADLQIRLFDGGGYPPRFARPWPGTAKAIWGTPPAEARDLPELKAVYLARAEVGLDRLRQTLPAVSESWLGSRDEDLAAVVYRLGSILKDALFSAGIVIVGAERS
jgi:hypothetical protein